ncbi:MAG: hypothetical protein C4582_11745 [Desulfobacteraceae bacterium]|nr:MAG: hypothetical protein C4582_11745 [Desulfobacteraceae bacterium]
MLGDLFGKVSPVILLTSLPDKIGLPLFGLNHLESSAQETIMVVIVSMKRAGCQRVPECFVKQLFVLITEGNIMVNGTGTCFSRKRKRVNLYLLEIVTDENKGQK